MRKNIFSGVWRKRVNIEVVKEYSIFYKKDIEVVKKDLKNKGVKILYGRF